MSTEFTSMRNDPQNIFEMQKFLNYISRFYKDIPKVNPDGIYGTETEAAVKGFQKRFGLSPTGEADFNTWTAIVDTYRILQRKNGMPKPVFVFPLNIVSMKEGDSFDEVYVLQVMLRRMGKIFQNITDVEITGVYDENTVRAVKDVKACCGMTGHSGGVDRELWNIIADTYSAFTFND